MSILRAVMAASLAFLPFDAVAFQAPKQIPEGKQQPYSVLRAEMIRMGWKPFHATHFDYDYYCLEGGGICKKFPELLSCSGAGHVTCTFGFYKNNPKRYRVVILNDDFPPNGKVNIISRPREYDMDYFKGRPGEPSIAGAKRL